MVNSWANTNDASWRILISYFDAGLRPGLNSGTIGVQPTSNLVLAQVIHPYLVKLLGIALGLHLFGIYVFGQSAMSTPPSGPASAAVPGTLNVTPPESERILGIIPNFRTSASLHPYVPISSEKKFKLASQDAFDRGTVALALLFGGEAQLTRANPSFGNGGAAFGRYFATSYGSYVIGDFMTEGIFPTLLHQDPRYFRKGSGSGWSRLGYALGQIVVTHNDEGRTAFNYSEILGNSTAVAISESYYPDNRDASDAAVQLVNQLGIDAASNVLKEFWPEIQRKFSRKH